MAKETFYLLPKNGGKGRDWAVGPVAQVVEQLTFNQWVEGSNPSGLTTFTHFIEFFSQQPGLLCMALLTGDTPSILA